MTDRSAKLKERDKWKAEKKIKLKELDLREKELEKEKTGQFQYRLIVKLPKFEEGQEPSAIS